MSLWGSPAAEKRGIFWPRAMEFMVSIVEMPVWIISSGYVRSAGLMDAPVMSTNCSASTGGLQMIVTSMSPSVNDEYWGTSERHAQDQPSNDCRVWQGECVLEAYVFLR